MQIEVSREGTVEVITRSFFVRGQNAINSIQIYGKDNWIPENAVVSLKYQRSDRKTLGPFVAKRSYDSEVRPFYYQELSERSGILSVSGELLVSVNIIFFGDDYINKKTVTCNVVAKVNKSVEISNEDNYIAEIVNDFIENFPVGSTRFHLPVKVLFDDFKDSLSGLKIIDSYQLKEGDKVLCVGRGTASGIYEASSGTWKQIYGDLVVGDLISIEEGETYKGDILKKMEQGHMTVVHKGSNIEWKVVN